MLIALALKRLAQSLSGRDMKPDARQHKNPDPAYLAGLIRSTEWPQHIIAARLGVSPRVLSNYLSGHTKAPYCFQYALEQLADRQNDTKSRI